MNILFMGTPEFSIPSLVELSKGEDRIVAVVTKPDKPAGRGYRLTPPPIKLKAEALKLPVWQPTLTEELYSLMKKERVDLVVVVAYGKILKKEILLLPTYGCINVHPSLLPKYRGPAPIQWAIINGESHTGVTVMWMNEGLDSGNIILQEKVEISKTDNGATLSERLSFVSASLLMKVVTLIKENKAPSIPQDESLATYAPILKKEDTLIDWSESAERIYNLIRALSPNIGAYTCVDGKLIKIFGAEVLSEPKEGFIPGEVVRWSKSGPVVATGEGLLVLTCLQPPNKKRLSGTEYLSGYREMRPGVVLGN